MDVRWKFVGGIVLAAVALVGAAGSGFYAGYLRGAQEPREVVLNLQNIAGSSTAPDFNTFWQAWDIVQREALHGEELEDKDLLYGAIRGVVGSLKDPHSVFLPPQDAKKFNEDISGSFGGVGMEIGEREGRLVVIAPLKDTPADKAGLKAQDYIIKVDDQFTDPLDVDEAVNIIRGPVGTAVTLLVHREGWTEPREFTITRGNITIPTIDITMLDENGEESDTGPIAYLQLYNFNEKVPQLFYEALLEAERAGGQKIILDLRNNPGGFLEVAVHLAGYWVPKGEVVVEEVFRNGKAGQTFRSDGDAPLKDFPAVILINGGSASASEILAGALRDQLGTKLIGTTTFGKGTVQTLRELTDGSNIKITIANWVLPKGDIIEGNGLEPDIEIKITAEDIEEGNDPQFEKALEIIGAMQPNLIIEKVQ